MNKIQIIADSLSPQGHRLITAIATFPRYLLAEVNTHRMLSRNSASSRAIRFEKMVQSVMDNPFIPFKWQVDHPGMQGTKYITNPDVIASKRKKWLEARDSVVDHAKKLHSNEFLDNGGDYWDFRLIEQENTQLTKQLCNRLLEPFMYHTALISGTELENFFALRAQDAAEIHFQDLAYKFLDAANQSEPKQLKAGDWHIPFGDKLNEDELKSFYQDSEFYNAEFDLEVEKVKLSTSACARISYVTPEGDAGISNFKNDLNLHDRLASSGHWSAFEHCARVMTDEEYSNHLCGVVNWEKLQSSQEEWPEYPDPLSIEGWCGNFRGFIQYRKMFSDENRSDNRLIKK